MSGARQARRGVEPHSLRRGGLCGILVCAGGELAYIEPCMLRFVLLYGGKSEFCFLPASWIVYGYGCRQDL
jgi:hypothetical protein